MKPNWVCSYCGMWSTRKFSVKRHITNQHNGYAYLVPYIEYLVGRQSGLYLPSAQPDYQYKENKAGIQIFMRNFGRNWQEKLQEETRVHNFHIR